MNIDDSSDHLVLGNMMKNFWILRSLIFAQFEIQKKKREKKDLTSLQEFKMRSTLFQTVLRIAKSLILKSENDISILINILGQDLNTSSNCVLSYERE